MSGYNASEWKPGDVAMVNGTVCMRVGNSWEHGDQRAFKWEDHETLDARRLAVIDTADWSLMLSLVQTMSIHQPGEVITKTAERLQVALREFASPTPRIEEPQRLGAVVEAMVSIEGKPDRGPYTFALAEDGGWLCLTDGRSGEHYGWPFLTAVRVLSEGVTE